MATFKLGDEGSSDSSLRQADPQDDPPQSSPKQSRFEVNVVSEDPSSDPGNLEASNHKLGIDDASFEQSMQMHTLGQMTMEAKPSIENYRNMFSIVTEPGMKSRPTLQDLHDPKVRIESKSNFHVFLFFLVVEFYHLDSLSKKENLGPVNLYVSMYVAVDLSCFKGYKLF